MDEQWFIIWSAAGSVFVIIAGGMASRKIGILSEEADTSLLNLIIRVLLPCLIFSAVSRNEALREPSNVLLPPVVGFASIVLGFAVAAAVARLGHRLTGMEGARQRRTFAFCVGVYNYGFLAIPLVRLLFDDHALGVLFVHNLGVELAFWTVGVMLISGRLGPGWWRHAINPASVTIVVALGFNYTNTTEYLPGAITTAIGWLGQSAIPMSLVLIGASIADQLGADANGSRAVDGAKVAVLACGLRLFLLPLAMIMLVAMLPASIELRRVVAIQAAMPSAVFSIVMARHYGGDSATALRVVMATSLVALATIPLWIPAGLALLGVAAP